MIDSLEVEVLARFKARVRELTRRTRGQSLAQVVRELTSAFAKPVGVADA